MGSWGDLLRGKNHHEAGFYASLGQEENPWVNSLPSFRVYFSSPLSFVDDLAVKRNPSGTVCQLKLPLPTKYQLQKNRLFFRVSSLG